MKYKNIYLLVFLLTVLTQGLWAQNTLINSEDCVKGRIRIKLKQEQLLNVNSTLKSANGVIDGSALGIDMVDDISNEVGIQRIKRVFPFSIKNEQKHRKYGLHLWMELEFDEGINPLSVVDMYEGLDELEIVKPVINKIQITSDKVSQPYKVEVLSKGSATLKSSSSEAYEPFFNDPLLPDQWHYQNDGRIGTDSIDTGMFEAWDVTTGSSDIIVAIIDQGIDVFHEDLAANIWRNEAEINGTEGVDDDGNGYIDDYYGYNFNQDGPIVAGEHGTHVAGTVGAVSNNGVGVAGVAGGDGSGNGVKLMGCQVFDPRSSGGVNFAAAIIYAADNGAIIAQNSWGYNSDNYYEPEVYEAIKYFVETAGTDSEGNQVGPMKGGILFFAAGNDGTEGDRYPAAFEEVVGVTSISADGFPAPYTNYGSWADIGALGGDQTNFGTEGGILSTLPNDEYGYMEGTSMACPHVSGVAALVISKLGGDGFTAEDLTRIMLNSSDRFIFQHENKYGTGLLNAANALADDNRIPPEAITDLRAVEAFHDEIRLEWTVPVDEDNGEPRSYYLSVSQSEITADNFDNHAIFLLENELSAGETFEINIGGLSKLTKYWFAVKSADAFENLSDISNILETETSNLPHFMSSTRSIEVDVDVTETAIHKIPVQFSNIGDGIVYYAATVNNEEYYQELEETEEELEETLEELAAEASTNPELFETTLPFTQSLTKLKSTSEVPAELEHWNNDVTEFVAGISYQNETSVPDVVMGSGNSNAGLIFATRFDIDYDLSFNLTHVQVALLPEVNDKPIIVEIKKGSKWVQESETVYLQEYYPDTTNLLAYYNIPLYKPQRFEDNEIFWVVLHFPKEMSYPMAMQYDDVHKEGYFIMSRDNGNSYEEAFFYIFRPIVPMVTALSSGNDGSYVFLDPKSGEIQKGETQDLNVIVDATNLTNGKHLASLGIITNDIHKPIINIEVKVDVDGQLPVVDTSKAFDFKAYINKENEFYFGLENTGLSNFEVYDVISSSADISKAFTDTVIIEPTYTNNVPFNYTPTSAGLVETQVTLVTNIGNVSLSTEFRNVDAPVLAITSDNIVNVAYGDVATLDVELKNTGSTTVLEYDLSHYSKLNISKGILPSKLTYQTLSSSEPDGPVDGTWEDISSFAKVIRADSILSQQFELEMGFPFYTELITNVNMNRRGQLYFFSDGLLGNDPETEYYGSAKGLLVPIWIEENYLSIIDVEYYSFGDHSVFTVHADIYSPAQSNLSLGQIEYQVVLFRDGSIEYRYKNVDDLDVEWPYTIAIQGLIQEDLVVFKEYEDTDNLLYNGKVLRFEPTVDLSMIVSATPNTGIINSGESVNIQLEIDPAAYQRMEDVYNNDFIINTNTAAKQEILPFTINVTGTPEIEVVDSVRFEPTRLGFSGQSFISLKNIGSAPISVTAAASNPQFTFADAQPVIVNSGGIFPLEVNFTPTEAKSVEATATITTSTGELYTVVLSGTGELDPSFDLTVASNIVIDINGGVTFNVPMSINVPDDSSPLEYTFMSNLLSFVDSDDALRGEGPQQDAVLEDYGYWWNVSDSLNNFHKWEDITDYAEILDIRQDTQKLVVLPFEFPFYGGLYDSIWVSKNGYVTVIEPEIDLFPLEFTKDDGLSGVIAPFGSTMVTDDSNGVKMLIEEDRLVLQWDDYVPETDPGIANFQLEMLANGTIYFHYKNVETWGYLLNYGLESPDEEQVLEHFKTWIAPWAHFTDNSTIAILPPLKGQLDGGDRADFDLVLSAKDIYASGVYKDTLSLYTNSKAQAITKIPFELNVTGSPELTTATSLVWDEVIYKENLMLEREVQLVNIGHETMSITQIVSEQLNGVAYYDESGAKLVMNGSGILLSPITLAPWDVYKLKVEVPIAEKSDVSGSISWIGNFTTFKLPVSAKLVDSPSFAWTATDQSFSLINTEVENFSFSISNNSKTNLKYTLAPAVVPTSGETEWPIVIEGESDYTFNTPLIVESLQLDKREEPDNFFDVESEGVDLAFSNKFTSPDGGFFMTHISTITNLSSVGEFIKVMVYLGGDEPQAGELMYEEQFVIGEVVSNEWIYFPLQQPINIPANEEFYVVITHPKAVVYMGVENNINIEEYKNSYSGTYFDKGVYKWTSHGDLFYDQYVWKIRPLTASGDDTWIELDHYEANLEPGESQNVTATIDPSVAGKGDHKALIVASSNDVNTTKSEVTINLHVNGAPEFVHRPNSYKDTLVMVETDDLILNYLFVDPEGEEMTFTLEALSSGPQVKYEQTGATTAQISIKTDYDDEGDYSYPVTLTDASGSLALDTVVIKILDKNRPPVFNSDFDLITLNIADPRAFTIDPNDLFTDPDGDELEIMAGNYSPEILDMSLGSVYINLNPLVTGTGLIAFGADDGKEDGFVIYGVYVQVIDDADAVDTVLDGIGGSKDPVLADGEMFKIYPNPVLNGNCNIQYKVEEDSDVTIEVFNSMGTKVNAIVRTNVPSGSYSQAIEMDSYGSGIYVFRILIGKSLIISEKVMVK